MTLDIDNIFEDEHVINRDDLTKLSYLKRDNIGSKWKDVKDTVKNIRRTIITRVKCNIEQKNEQRKDKIKLDVENLFPYINDYCDLKIHTIASKNTVSLKFKSISDLYLFISLLKI